MGVRVVGVPVVDGYPIEPRSQVRRDSVHQVPGEGAQVIERVSVLGRDDKAELMAIIAAARFERLDIDLIGQCAVGPSRLAITPDALSLDVAQVRRRGSAAGALEIHQARLDGDTPQMDRATCAAELSHDMTTAEAGAWPCRSRVRLDARLVGLAKYLANEGLATLLRRRDARPESVLMKAIPIVHHCLPGGRSGAKGCSGRPHGRCVSGADRHSRRQRPCRLQPTCRLSPRVSA